MAEFLRVAGRLAVLPLAVATILLAGDRLASRYFPAPPPPVTAAQVTILHTLAGNAARFGFTCHESGLTVEDCLKQLDEVIDR